MSFSIKERDFLSKRISHFLIGYRRRHHMTQDDLAKKLGVNKSTVCRFERLDQNSIINSLEAVQGLAKLEDFTLNGFIDYLFMRSSETSAESLLPWQSNLLKTFGKTDQVRRLKACHSLSEIGEDQEKLDKALDLIETFHKLDKESVTILAQLASRLAKS